MLVAVISDTHLPRSSRRIPEACLDRLGEADLILHAGDVVAASVLDELETLGPPVRAVRGNMDEPALRELVELHERLALPARPARVAAVALNTRALGESEARASIEAAEAETRLPADDPVRFGAAKLVDAVLAET